MAITRWTGLFCAATAAALTTTTASAAGPLVRVSDASPFAGCRVATHGARVYTNAEVEPQVATNPANANNLIGAWQQDRWSTGGSHGLVAGYSFDGGRTWNETPLPFDRCSPGGLNYERASDPWVSIGPDGTAYAVGLSLSNPNSGPAAVAAVTSRDGGRNWGNLRVIKADSNGALFFDDKESVTADPTHPGVAYVVWDRGRPAPAGHFRFPTLFAKTTDWGRTWSTPRAIAATGMDEEGTGNVILVNSRTHRLFDFYTFYFCTCVSTPEIQYVTSDDLGSTWSGPHIVNTMDALPVTNPNTGELVRTEDFTSTQAIDPVSGAMYVAWQTPRFHGTYDEIAFTSSMNGLTWTPEVQVSTPTGRSAFTPTVAVAHGTVGLTYYDFRALGPNNTATLPTDLWFKNSDNGGRTWSTDQKVAGPFDMKAAPVSEGRGFFIGDYQGLTGVGTTFVPFFVQTNCRAAPCTQNRTDVYAAQMSPATAAVATPRTSLRFPTTRPASRPPTTT